MIKSKKGFTLVELIVVIAILGILAGVGMVAYNGYIEKAQSAADLSTLDAVKTAASAASALEGEVSEVKIAEDGMTVEVWLDGATAVGDDATAADHKYVYGTEWTCTVDHNGTTEGLGTCPAAEDFDLFYSSYDDLSYYSGDDYDGAYWNGTEWDGYKDTTTTTPDDGTNTENTENTENTPSGEEDTTT